MIAYVKGIYTYADEESIVLDVNGIGYRLKVTNTIFQFLPSFGEEVKIHTYTYVREDAIQLFGFISQDELNFFKKLITVNGIGPKGALAILSSMSVDVLKYSILMSDSKSIAKAPGIGLKTAERLILDLRDKIKQEDVNSLTRVTETGMPQSSLDPIKQEAVEALVALGYLSKEAFAAVKAVTVSEIYTTEDVLKEALKHLF